MSETESSQIPLPDPPAGIRLERLIRFDRRDAPFVAICVTLAILSIAISVKYFEAAFPEASIDFRVTRQESQVLAERFITTAKLGAASLGAKHAAAFEYDETAQLFLERNFGLERANQMMAGEIKMWRWGHRWFTPLEKEEYRATVTTRGAIAGFAHELPEDAPGANLDATAARPIAEAFAATALARLAADWEFLDVETDRRPRRTDHVFTWKRAGRVDLDRLDASYRATVTVAGDRVTGFQEFLHVPEKWRRDYDALRSRNATAGTIASTLLILTLVAIVAVFLVETRRANVAWKVASGLAAAGFLLQLGSSLNVLPLDLYHYDTTDSFTYFVAVRLLLSVVGACGVAVLIFLLSAGGEPVYRRAYPQHVALSGLFSLAGLRTKTFFKSTVLGLTLTCFFMAYQAIFYLVAGKLGAWAPQEIGYSELLNTRFPWIAVLFIGFLPAVSEEFWSRMFSIPFFERWLKWRTLAVWLAAFIWGFAHASYPNQPFYIRGLEVGIAGVIVGYIMLRFGILATLIWHYTVDALYTGFLLLRSDNLYFQTTAAVGIGIMLFPLAGALIAYLRRGGFLSETPLLNGSQASPHEHEPIERERPAPPRAAYTPLGKADLALVAGLGLAAAALLAVPADSVDDAVSYVLPKSLAREVADTRVTTLGADPATFKTAVVTDTDFHDVAAKYRLTQSESIAAVAETYRTRLAAALWKVRYFRPGEKEEFRIFVEGDRQQVWSEAHLLDEASPGADLGEEAARAIATVYLGGLGETLDPSRYTLKEARSQKRPLRRDWTFAWEDAEKFRHTVVVAGDRVTVYHRSIKVPEAFERARDERGILWFLGIALKVLVYGLLAGTAVVLAIREFRQGNVPIRRALALGGIVGALFLATSVNALPQVLADQYDTTFGWNLFLVTIATGLGLVAILTALAAALAYGLVVALYPAHTRPLTGHWRDAALGAAAFLALRTALPAALEIAGNRYPAAVLFGGIDIPAAMSMTVPYFGLVSAWGTGLVFSSCLGAIAAHIYTEVARTPWQRATLVGLVTLALVPLDARSVAEYALHGAFAVAGTLGTLLVVKRLWRGNALAFVAGAGLVSAAGATSSMIAQPEITLRGQGILALATMLAILGYILWRGDRARRHAEALPDSQSP